MNYRSVQETQMKSLPSKSQEQLEQLRIIILEKEINGLSGLVCNMIAGILDLENIQILAQIYEHKFSNG